MRHFNCIGFVVLLLAALGTFAAETELPWFNELPDSERYQRVSTLQHVALEEAFLALFRQQQSAEVGDFYDVKQTGEVVLASSHPELGWGAWSYWNKAPNQVFLQIPHRFYDLDTDVFAQLAWQQKLAQLVMMNSVHRYSGKQQQPTVNSDISNARHSPLLAASEAWLAVNPEGLIVQLHGFSQSKRATERGKTADIILSHGNSDKFLNWRRLSGIQSCLQDTLAVSVVRYPQQVGELGGTLNNVAKALKRWRKSEQFIHVEMSREVRQLMARDKQAATRVLQCLLRATD